VSSILGFGALERLRQLQFLPEVHEFVLKNECRGVLETLAARDVISSLQTPVWHKQNAMPATTALLICTLFLSHSQHSHQRYLSGYDTAF